MRKYLLPLLMPLLLCTAGAQAQNNPPADPAVMMQRMKERIKPSLIEKTGLSDEQADKTIAAQFQWQRQSRELRMNEGLSAEEKEKKTKEADAAREKEWAAIPLNEAQIVKVKAFFEEMRQQQMERRRGN